MYIVQGEIPQSFAQSQPETVWTDFQAIPQMETEQLELQEARRVRRQLRLYLRSTRIVKPLPSGLLKVVA